MMLSGRQQSGGPLILGVGRRKYGGGRRLDQYEMEWNDCGGRGGAFPHDRV
jgi:hypothetical protein